MRIISTAISVLLLALNLHTAALISVHNITTFMGFIHTIVQNVRFAHQAALQTRYWILQGIRKPTGNRGFSGEYGTLDNGQEVL